ncbi:MAG: DUF1289 domain-containing protein [Motiliproteus sp.]
MSVINPAINSPCIRNCCLDEQDICLGCGRSLDEILQWGGADDRRKRQILKQIAVRKQERQNNAAGHTSGAPESGSD